jgi:hypothetical protein
MALTVCREVISQLEKVQENKQLLVSKINLIKLLRSRILWLAAIERDMAKQRSRQIWMMLGDANTKYFHMVANQRKKKNCIHSLQSNVGVPISQEGKQKVAFEHFNAHIGTHIPWGCSLNLDNLSWPSIPLHCLEEKISEAELLATIQASPKEKALGLDGFIGLFFSTCWGIIKDDLLRAVAFF